MRVSLSLSLAALAALAAPAFAQPAEERLAVLVGANVGEASDEPLRYAESDARRVREALVELGGVRAARATLVLGGGTRPVLDALTEARGRAAELTASGHRVVLLFYFSGHGDDGALHLAGERLPLQALRERLEAIPAAVRLTLLDSCRTGGRAKGVRRGPEFALGLTPTSPEGSVELRAASAGEAAQESEELQGALFTHALLSGLRGAADVDRDGRVTLFELYAYAYRRTLLESGAAVSAQRATLSVELRGAGELVLSQPARAASTLQLPPSPVGRYIVFSLPSGAVMGELSEGALSLPAGQFLVQQQAGARRAVARVDLAWGGTRRLAEKDFVAVSREELVARGGRVELRPYRLSARGGVEVSPGAVELPGLRAGAAFVRLAGPLELEVELCYLRGGARTDGFGGGFQSVSLVPAVGVRALFGAGALSAQAGVEGRYTFAALARPDAERLRAAGLPAEEHLRYPSLGPRLALSGALSLGADFVASATANGAWLFRQERLADGARRLTGRPALGLSLGMGRAF